MGANKAKEKYSIILPGALTVMLDSDLAVTLGISKSMPMMVAK